MTEIMVSKRDGVATAPDGTKFRVSRGKTLADARHPVVVAHPNDWSPMTVELTVDASTASVAQDAPEASEIDELRNDLAEAEETAQDLQAALQSVVGVLADVVTLPPEDEREAGWLTDAVRTALSIAYARGKSDATPAVQPPRTPRKRAPGRPADDDD